jgi:hypothetical protein
VIELVEEEAELVLAICEMYDAGVGVSEIRRRLISDDASQKRNLGRRHDWHPVIIYNVLRCEDYTGQTVWRFGDGKEYRIEIPQIVPRDLWERNQKRLERNKLLSTRNAHGVYLLQGLLECGECQGSLGVRCQHSYNDRKGRRRPLQNPYHEYVCQVANLHREEGHPRPYVVQGQRLDWEVWRYIVDNGIRRPDLIHMQVLARQEQLQRQGDSVDGEINHARRRLAEVDQERAFYQRQGARGKIDEAEFDARMAESEETRRYWQAEINRLTELRDDAAKVRLGLAYVTELLGSLQARLPEIDQSPKQLKAMAEEQRHAILRQRQEIIRAMAEKVIVWSDRQVKIEGVLDGGEGPQFGLTGPWPC